MEDLRIDPSIAYDVLELPSKGIHYSNGKKSIRVAYLTASDENILASPNLPNTTSVINELLKRKVLDKDLSIDEIVEEDKQAILIFLRNTAFGSEYKFNVIDPKTQKEFETIVDLSEIKVKEFNLKPDINDEYSYFLEKSNVDITFKFLTQKQEDEIEKIRESWNGNGVAPVITKQLEFMIQTIGGVRDPLQIRNFIETKMPIKDSQDFKKFVRENKPGLDLTKKITTPSGDTIQINVGFGVDFFRPFYGL
jgi:hypothetical protein